METGVMVTTGNKKRINYYETVSGDSFAKEYPLSILIAEDNIINQKLIERMLHKLGYQTHTVSDGAKVVETIGNKFYDLILMDLYMPLLNGPQATLAIRNMEIEQPYIIAMTASTTQDDIDECMQSGMNDYISKPISFQEVSQLLKRSYDIITSKKGS